MGPFVDRSQRTVGAKANFSPNRMSACGWPPILTRDDPPILTGHDNKRRTVVKRGFVVAVGGAAIVIAGLSGCSSDEKKSESSGSSRDVQCTRTASASATAAPSGGGTKVTIDGQDQNVAGTVVCSTMGGNMNIAIGDAATGIAAVRQRGRQPDRPFGRPRQRQRRDAGLPGRTRARARPRPQRTAAPTRSRAPRPVSTWPTPCSR